MKSYTINENDLKTILVQAIDIGIAWGQYSVIGKAPIDHKTIESIVSSILDETDKTSEYDIWLKCA